jgi:hypothetical protein
MIATTTATMTQVPARTTATRTATTIATLLKLDECFLHPAKMMANDATLNAKVFCFMPDSAQQS